MPPENAGKSYLDPKNLLAYIRTSIYGNQNDPKMDDVDASISRISSRILNKDARNHAELMRMTVSRSLEKETFDTIPGGLASDVETLGRLTRYINAEEIVDCIPYCARALKVLTDGIISPDDVTKKSIQVLMDNQIKKDDQDVRFANNIIDNVNIDYDIRDIVYETLKYGDQFVEICDYRSRDVPITQSLLSESGDNTGLTETDLQILEDSVIPIKVPLEEGDEREFNIQLSIITEKDSSIQEQIALAITEDIDRDGLISKLGRYDKKDDELKSSKIEKTELSDVRLILHSAGNVVKIQSKRYRMCLGYLVLPEFQNGLNPFFGGTNTGSSSKSVGQFGLSSLMSTPAMTTGVDAIYSDMIGKVKKYLKNDEIFVNKREVMTLLKRAIGDIDFMDSEYSDKNVPFNLRFVPVNRMEHFAISSQRFFPYGESIFYKSSFQAKLLIALETAITIKRISDSVDRRLIYIETGLPRDARNVIEELKTALKKRKFSIDTLGTVGNVPSSITAYEDIYVPISKGKRFVEFDTLQSPIQIREVVDELKYFRDMIVAGLDVPPAYVNLEENLSNKSALSFENGIFAQTVVAYQLAFSKHLHNLISKIMQMINGRKLKESITITFPPPKMLQMERDAERYDMVARIVQSLSDMGVPRDWAIKRYLDLPWDEIDKHGTTDSIENKVTPPEDPMGGMGAMGGMGGMPMGGGGMPPMM